MTLDDIKRDIRHDDECASIEGANGWEGTAPECNCSRRDKIALLERLQEPTIVAWEAMRNGIRQVYYCKDIAEAMSDNGALRQMTYAESE